MNSLTYVRTKNNLTQKDLAVRSGVQLSRIQLAEQNIAILKLNDLIKISTALGLCPSTFSNIDLDICFGDENHA